jgi:uncharacterized protein (DUF433 family)
LSPDEEKMHENLLAHIVADPGVCGGRACVRDTAIAVADILDKLASGYTQDELIGDYPPLSPLGLQAAIAFAAQLVRTTDAARAAPTSDQD